MNYRLKRPNRCPNCNAKAFRLRHFPSAVSPGTRSSQIVHRYRPANTAKLWTEHAAARGETVAEDRRDVVAVLAVHALPVHDHVWHRVPPWLARLAPERSRNVSFRRPVWSATPPCTALHLAQRGAGRHRSCISGGRGAPNSRRFSTRGGGQGLVPSTRWTSSAVTCRARYSHPRVVSPTVRGHCETRWFMPRARTHSCVSVWTACSSSKSSPSTSQT